MNTPPSANTAKGKVSLYVEDKSQRRRVVSVVPPVGFHSLIVVFPLK